jgi:hypothetical protein
VDLRKWKPLCERCEKISDKCTCKNRTPPPSADYLLDEAARFRGYTQREWDSEPFLKKARVLAHFLEHNIRESYAMERARLASKKDKGKEAPKEDWSRFRQGGRKGQ